MKSTIGIIIVDYHTPFQTIAYIKEQVCLCSLPYKIAVVVNDFYKSELDIYKNELNCLIVYDENTIDQSFDVYVIPSAENLGYGKGNNKGAKFINTYFSPEFLCFSNNDINFKQNDPFVGLISKLTSIDDCGLIGPRIIGLDGKDQNPHRYLSFKEKYFDRNLLSPLKKLMKIESNSSTIVPNASPGFFYRLIGCFMIIKSDIFFKCGMFDESTFLFGEESILSERLSNINYKCYYYPKITIIHEHGQTINKHFTIIKKLILEFKADKYYYTRYKKVSKSELYFSILFFNLYIFLHFLKILLNK